MLPWLLAMDGYGIVRIHIHYLPSVLRLIFCYTTQNPHQSFILTDHLHSMMKHFYPDGSCFFQDDVSCNHRARRVKICPYDLMPRYAQLTGSSIINITASFLFKYISHIFKMFVGLLKINHYLSIFFKKERECVLNL